MKETGMSRRVDDLGRIVIPAEIRRSFGLGEGVQLDISVDDGRLVLAKREDSCVFCASRQDLKEFKSRMVCRTCVGDLTGEPQSSWEPFSES